MTATDDQQRYFFQIMLLELNAFNNCKPFLADTVFLEEANHATVSQSIVKCLSKYNIGFDFVYGYGSDNVKYMVKSFNTALKNIMPNIMLGM